MKLIDTHSHIYAEEFDADRDEALARARAEGVGKLLLPAIDAESDERLFDLVRREPDYCFAMPLIATGSHHLPCRLILYCCLG